MTDQSGGHLRPHRGAMILVFGILGIVMCGFFAIPAWIMGNADIQAMDDGAMDPSGRDITNAGRICGIIGTILLGLICLGGVAWGVLMAGIASTGMR